MSIADIEADTAYLANCERELNFGLTQYLPVHGCIATTICLLGCAANAINIIVLSRKEMASITNSILIALAVADFLVMINYIPYALYEFIPIIASNVDRTYGWAIYLYFNTVFTHIFQTASISLTIILASWRYIAIKFPLKNNRLCTKRNTVIAITLAYAVSPILSLPVVFLMQIQEIPMNSFEIIDFNDVSKDTVPFPPEYVIILTGNKPLFAAMFGIYSVLLKLIPCIVLTILSVLLIVEMKLSDRRRKNLLKPSSSIAKEASKLCLRHANNIDRTTRMLLGLLGLFIVTELPLGVMGLMNAVAPQIFGSCYYTIGLLSDLFILLGAAVNFVIYCSMSRQFKTTFVRLARKVLPSPCISNRQMVSIATIESSMKTSCSELSLAVISMVQVAPSISGVCCTVQQTPENIEEG